MGTGKGFRHLSREALNILLSFETTYRCESGFSEVAAIRTKYRSMMNVENDLTAAI
jgi:hypothetical protein